ncbi:MAG TPA: DmsC/YnfH family molybdoenzyme membrane anchor subunit [Fibrobacteria bacterium]|nr:DmsC/YnfH family molybdoenzyme membrane anchor subunit [Fibrobacteria bacterium]
MKPSLSRFLGDGQSLIDAYLEEQQNLTAVERFSSAHDRMHGAGTGLQVGQKAPAGQRTPSLESHYKDLLPLEKPRPGQQYAFEVDLDRCTGCKACVTACHNLNGLDEDETWRSVGLIHNVIGKPLQQTVTTACQHCLEPACSHGCPVKAYEKDPVTGIVKHLDDQCIGCEYCILKCPYDVPQYHHGKGIVRKCDMCVGRLEAGEAPACVQACPTKAIKITLVDQAEVRRNFADYAALPGAPDPAYTLPTTRYTTARKFPAGMEAGDAYKVKKEKAHYPLVFMLVLSQMAAGFAFFLEAGSLAGLLPADPLFQAAAHVLGAGLIQLAIAVSMTHLGRPLYAFRAVLGFRRSWLSREIVAFGLMGALGGALAAATTVSALIAFHVGPSALLAQWGPALARWSAFASAPWLRAALALSALVAVHCSAMVYRDTPRAMWASRITSGKFFLSGVLTGAAGLLLLIACFDAFGLLPPSGASGRLALGLTLLLPFALIAKLGCEAGIHRHLDDQEATPLKKAALLLRGGLRFQNIWRFNAGLAGGFLLPILWLYRGYSGTGAADTAFAAAALALILAGECLERYLFFAACVPPRMPGA